MCNIMLRKFPGAVQDIWWKWPRIAVGIAWALWLLFGSDYKTIAVGVATRNISYIDCLLLPNSYMFRKLL